MEFRGRTPAVAVVPRCRARGRANRYWKPDDHGPPTDEVVDFRRKAEFISPVPASTAQAGKAIQLRLALEDEDLSTSEQQYKTYLGINLIRQEVDRWRTLPEAS